VTKLGFIFKTLTKLYSLLYKFKCSKDETKAVITAKVL